MSMSMSRRLRMPERRRALDQLEVAMFCTSLAEGESEEAGVKWRWLRKY